MCGISVLLDRSSSPDGARQLLRMHAAIPHRGPDGEGFLWLDGQGSITRSADAAACLTPSPLLGMAFRRLKIIDLSEAADQPLGTPDGAMFVVFNGEIYNYRELRRELVARGYPFRSQGDAEVVLAAFACWGEAAFARLEGMWGLVIADLRRRRVVASRDRFGIKPLHWCRDGERLLLSSEIRQILAARTAPPDAHRECLLRFLKGSLLPRIESTFFEGVREVPPASWVEWAFDDPIPPQPVFRRYWRLEDSVRDASPRLDYPEALSQFGQSLSDAVDSHSVADVPIGALLSGGLDSATIVALLASRERGRGRVLPTFSFGFRDAAPEVCELKYVDVMVGRQALAHHETSFDGTWVAANTPRVVRTLEEPTLAMPALAQFRVFELVGAAGLKVVFDGQGADEILAGYPYYQRALLGDHLRRGRLGQLRSELVAIARRERRGVASVLAQFFGWPLLARMRRRRYAWLDSRGDSSDQEARAALRDRGPADSAVARALFFDVKWGNVRIILSYADRSSMAHSVEARVPYFDRRLVELAFRQQDSFKVGAGERKRILRDFARTLVAPEITERVDRLGFGVPEAKLLRGPLWSMMRAVLGGRRLREASFLRARPMDRFVTEFEHGRHTDGRALWRLFTLGVWAEEFGVSL